MLSPPTGLEDDPFLLGLFKAYFQRQFPVTFREVFSRDLPGDLRYSISCDVYICHSGRGFLHELWCSDLAADGENQEELHGL